MGARWTYERARERRGMTTLAARTAFDQLQAGRMVGQIRAVGVIVAPLVVGFDTHARGVSQTPSAGVVSTHRQVNTLPLDGVVHEAAAGSSADRLVALYRTGSADLVHGTGTEMFEAVKMLKAANPQKYQPRNGA